MSRLVALCAVLLTACGSPTVPSPTASNQPRFTYPSELQAVIDLIDGDSWQHPLIGEPMGTWVRRHTHKIILDVSLPPHIGARANQQTHTIRWNPASLPPADAPILLTGQLLHEVRHLEGYLHTCGSHDFAGDRTFEEGGAYAVHILYLEHQHVFGEAARLRREFIGCH